MGGAEVKTAPYGTWTSPITSDIVSGSSLSFPEVHVDSSSGAIYLLEGRPSEKGRRAILRLKDNDTTEILPKEYSAQSKVHEYGGGAMAVSPSGSLVFTDGSTSGVFYWNASTEKVEEVIKGDKALRFADFHFHPLNPTLILAVQEDHRGKEVINSIALIDIVTKKAIVVIEDADFYSHPKFSPDGKKVSWLQWNHPDMPWTGTELWFGEWKDGEIKGKYVAGKAREESIAQPKWHDAKTLLFASDRTGFWQLYTHDIETGKTLKLPMEGFEDAELAGRDFILGCCLYVSLTPNLLAIAYTRNAGNGLITYNISTRQTTTLDTGLVEIQGCAVQRVTDTTIAVIGATPTAPTALYLIDIHNPTAKTVLRSSSSINLPETVFSRTVPISFPRIHGNDLGSLSHAMFIPPHNPAYQAPEGTKPPLIVFVHGGPTSHAGPGLARTAQYFTSRGYAYCFVNYAGSTGYGRKYREQLDYYWGLKDCEDTVSCIDYLSSQGLVDGTKVGLTGGSAGGYTTLQGMVTFPSSFTAGCSLYGIGNLKALGEDTHKFESHYLFALLFPEGTSEEEKEKIYFERSPCFHAEKIERPLVLLQGSIDRVVPPEQAREMEKILRGLGRDVKMVLFDGEGHGFQRSENIKAALEEEESLWKRTLL